MIEVKSLAEAMAWALLTGQTPYRKRTPRPGVHAWDCWLRDQPTSLLFVERPHDGPSTLITSAQYAEVGQALLDTLQVATQRGTVEDIKDDAAEKRNPAEPAAPLLDEAITRHGFNLYAGLTLAADDDLGRERLCRYGLRPPFFLARFRVLSDGRSSYRVKKSARRVSPCRIMTPVACIARLCALIPPPRY